MKNGFLTSEFISQLVGPYGIAFALIYFGLADTETMALVAKAISGLSDQAQAVVMLALKLASVIGAAYVGGKGAEVTKGYNAGRVQQKLKQQSDCQQ
jgi:hypothetical protein